MVHPTFTIEGQIVDIIHEKIYNGRITVQKGIIQRIEPAAEINAHHYILPGFIDAHIHIESSMLVPSEFARIATQHGTVATVSDPHEIANVLGVDGVMFMLQNGSKVPFHFNFGAPSCVPATSFETAGARLGIDDLKTLLKRPDIKYLSEMMNWPGVLHEDPEVMAKIQLAHSLQKPVDGHAPGLRGKEAQAYIEAGISTDHECYTLEEAAEKLSMGMKILIREGSAAKNYNALHNLIDNHHHQMMFCSDDKHPDELLEGHINKLVQRALNDGHELFKVLRMACLNPIQHYQLEHGMLREGDSADFIVMDDIQNGKVLSTYISGSCVYENGQGKIQRIVSEPINHFQAPMVTENRLKCAKEADRLRVIHVHDGELITSSYDTEPKEKNGYVVPDLAKDVLKLVVMERYSSEGKLSLGWIHGFGLKKGAIASTVAHDSHNIIACGTNDQDLVTAINELVKLKGGIAVVEGETIQSMPLEVGGLMSTLDYQTVADHYQTMDASAKSLGSKLSAPFMSLSFMALLVIPELKLSDKGLFDGNVFDFCSMFHS